jgi:alpha-galactosidase/6-phospho-beta-glucosidase family protein
VEYTHIKSIQRAVEAATGVTIHSNTIKRFIRDNGYDSQVNVVTIGDREYWQVPKDVAVEVVAKMVQQRKPAPITTPALSDDAIDKLHNRIASLHASVHALEGSLRGVTDELGVLQRAIQHTHTKLDKLLNIWDTMEDDGK